VDSLRLADQYLGAEVVDHVSIITSEVLDERRGIGPISKRQRRKIRPAAHPSVRSRSRITAS
jgi:hypothetical protein